MSTSLGKDPSREPEMADTRPIRVVIVDDHDLVREGLRAILDREDDMAVVADAETAEQALEILQALEADVVVLDQQLAGMSGVEACREMAERRIRAQAVILSAFPNEEAVQAALMAGARSFVLKDVDATALKRAIRAAARGEDTTDSKVRGPIMSWPVRLEDGLEGGLRPIEIKILRMLARGMPNKEIALLTGVATETVKTYLREIYRKLGVSARAEAVAAAVRRRLI